LQDEYVLLPDSPKFEWSLRCIDLPFAFLHFNPKSGIKKCCDLYYHSIIPKTSKFGYFLQDTIRYIIQP
jgi:hypothetical protein